LLEVKDLVLRFGGVTALDHISFTVADDEICGLIGPNGAGKTSLFNCVTGAYRPDAGSITFAGESLLGRSPDAVTRRGIARTFQNLRLFHNMTVLDNLLLGRHLHFRRRFSDAVLRRRAEEIRHRRACEVLIDFLNLQPYRKSRVADCSYGVQKRVELARALATAPRLLLLDEPGAGLDADEQRRLAALVRGLRDVGISIVLVDHHMDLVLSVADEVLVLCHGQRLAEGSPEAIRRDPAVVAAYLGEEAA